MLRSAMILFLGPVLGQALPSCGSEACDEVPEPQNTVLLQHKSILDLADGNDDTMRRPNDDNDDTMRRPNDDNDDTMRRPNDDNDDGRLLRDLWRPACQWL